jgi:replicative DNA helicase
MKDFDFDLMAKITEAVRNADTASEFAEALRTLDNTDIEQSADFINTLCKKRSIDPNAPELVDITRLCKEAREKAQQQAKDIKIKNTLQMLINTEQNIIKWLEDGGSLTDTENKNAICSELKNSIIDLMDLTQEQSTNRIATVEDIEDDLINYNPENDFAPSLFAGLSCPNGTISIIGARPGGGKTSVLINIAREALSVGRTVFFVNLEMTRRQIYTNLCLSFMFETANEEAQEELKDIKKTIIQFNKSFRQLKSPFHRPTQGKSCFDTLQEKALETVNKAITDGRLFIYDGIGVKLEDITADICAKTNAGDVVLIDYMQRLPTPSGSETHTRQVQIQKARNELLKTAIRKKAVVISGVQFNREGERNGSETTLYIVPPQKYMSAAVAALMYNNINNNNPVIIKLHQWITPVKKANCT